MTHRRFALDRRPLLSALLVAAAACAGAAQAGGEASKAAVFKAKDTVAFPAEGAVKDAAQAEALRSVHWKPADFEVVCVAKPAGSDYDAVVGFPSPRPSGVAKRDRVVLHWHKARGADGKPLAGLAPAVLALSPLSPALMETSDEMAESLAARGFHAFAIALPGSGPRRTNREQPMELMEVAAHPEQAVADLRRARDAVAALPGVNGKVGLEAMCFGGLAAIPAQAIDNAFDGVVVGFVGGDLNAFFGTLQGAVFQAAFLQAGWSAADLRALAARTDPGRSAARIDAAKFHFYSFSNDGMWPKACTDKLLADLRLPEASRTQFRGMHPQMFDKLPVLEARLGRLLAPETASKAAQKEKDAPKVAPRPAEPSTISVPTSAKD